VAGVDLSVIILNFNTKKLLAGCLKSVFKAIKTARDYRIEVIVVDNASQDGSPQMVKKEFPKVKLIINRRNLGFAAGNNRGIEKTRGRYLLFLNSDTEVFPEAFGEIISFMEKNPRAGAVTPKTLLASGKMDPDCHRGFPTPWASLTYFLGLEKLFPKSRFFGQYHQFYLGLDKKHEIDAGFGTFMIVPRQVIDQVGDWSEDYFFYGEDLDFFYRIKKSGWKAIFYPQPLLIHYKGASSGLRRESRGVARVNRQARVKAAKASIEAMEIFYKKFYQGKYPAWLTFIVLLGIRIKGFFRLASHYLKS
jgi:GT2 family glycosyltransferase